eukprot:8520290-Pyramimonas_sp.AAC.1
MSLLPRCCFYHQDNGLAIASELKTTHGTHQSVAAEFHLRDNHPLRPHASCLVHTTTAIVVKTVASLHRVLFTRKLPHPCNCYCGKDTCLLPCPIDTTTAIVVKTHLSPCTKDTFTRMLSCARYCLCLG